MRQLRRRSVRNPSVVLDILRYLSDGPNIKPVLIPCSFTRCTCPTSLDTRRKALEAEADARHLTRHRRREWVESQMRNRESCERLGFRFRFGGTAAHYCTLPADFNCAFQSPDWRPSPMPDVQPPERSRFAPNRWTLVVIRDVRDSLVRACADNGLVGATARAWADDEWREVDALGSGELVAFRIKAQEALAAYIAAELTARYYGR